MSVSGYDRIAGEYYLPRHITSRNFDEATKASRPEVIPLVPKEGEVLVPKGFYRTSVIWPQLEPTSSAKQARLEETLDSFNRAWLKYWESYITLQDQLYESIRAARELTWLAATDPGKLGEINRLQRELFAGMPRRLDYTPLGQISQDLDSAPSKIAELEGALESEEDGCKKMAEAIEILKAKIVEMKEALRVAQK